MFVNRTSNSEPIAFRSAISKSKLSVFRKIEDSMPFPVDKGGYYKLVEVNFLNTRAVTYDLTSEVMLVRVRLWNTSSGSILSQKVASITRTPQS